MFSIEDTFEIKVAKNPTDRKLISDFGAFVAQLREALSEILELAIFEFCTVPNAPPIDS